MRTTDEGTVLAWEQREDEDGDERLYCNRWYFGMICPHHAGYVTIVWGGGEHQNMSPDIPHAKAFLEAIACREASLEHLREAYPVPDPWDGSLSARPVDTTL